MRNSEASIDRTTTGASGLFSSAAAATWLRRDFLRTSAAAAAATALPAVARANDAERAPRGKADRCIFLWLSGGAAQIDTFDPKRKSTGRTDPGGYYDSIDTAAPGVQVCQHLSRTARVLDRCAILRTLHHDVIDEHAAATNRMHTGRPTDGTIVYPSVGSIVAHELGPGGEGVPSYIVMGYPNVTRGPGFLGSKYGYMYLTETDMGPEGLVRPPDVTLERQARREALLAELRTGVLRRYKGDRRIEAYAGVSIEAFKLAGPKFASVFNLDREPSSLRESYGSEFGQRCLLARRLMQAGVRFVEVSSNLNFTNGTGWDTHNEGQLKQHELIEELDQALASLILDLERVKLLDRTLIVVATEFGRPAQFDAGGGRGHHSRAFSCVLAGGGLNTGVAIGQTDDLAMDVVERPISVPDFFATIHAALGIDPAGELYDGERPVPITDRGKPVHELFG